MSSPDVLDGSKTIWTRVERGGTAYMLAFSGGAVKVGKTKHLRSRYNEHISTMRRRFGAELIDCHFTYTHLSYSATEDYFIAAAEGAMTPESIRVTREWFIDLDLERLQDLLLEADPTGAYKSPPVHARGAQS